MTLTAKCKAKDAKTANMPYRTAQERLWAGPFGDAYNNRISNPKYIAANAHLFSRALQRAPGIKSVFEIGSNIGLSLAALKSLLPSADFAAIEINKTAFTELRKVIGDRAVLGSILDYETDEKFDLVLTKGVLMHIDPSLIDRIYKKIFDLSGRFILLAEYYNPTPVEVEYRGFKKMLFKRDFCGDMLSRFPVKLIDYGFVYRRDPVCPQDDITWFLLEKL